MDDLILIRIEIEAPNGNILTGGVTEKMMLDNGFSEADIEKEIIKSKKLILKTNLVRKCDQVQKRILDSLLGERNTPSQLIRYERKYAIAKEGGFTKSKREAIIEKHEAFLSKTNAFVDMMELSRETLADAIDSGDFEKAEAFIKLSDTFTIETKVEDIQKALK